MADKWNLWFNRRGKLKGIAIVHPCSDYGLELHECLTQEGDRIEYAKKLCAILNAAGPVGSFQTDASVEPKQ